MLIKRPYFQIVKKELQHKEITALLGARQVGKTTILQKTYEIVKNEATFLTFDNLETLKLFETNIKLFIEQHIEPYKYIFIDEFQYAKSGGKHLKLIYDTIYRKIFISGSSSPEGAIHSLKYLVGLENIINIYPITFQEYLEYKNKTKAILLKKIRTPEELKQLEDEFNEYISYGGYPKIITEQNKERKEKLLKNIIQTYLSKEIKDILAYKNIFEYEKILTRLALQDTKLLNKSQISQQIEINRNKIDQILTTLHQTYVVSILQPFIKNKIRQQIKSPKTYFHDLGFKNSIINNFNTLELRKDKGEILENFIANELIRNEINVNFWNIDNRHEIDFVIERNNEIIGIEVKSRLSNNNIPKSVIKFIDDYNPKTIYIFNQNIKSEKKYKETKIIFTHLINSIPLLNQKLIK